MSEPMPRDVQITLFRALVFVQKGQVTNEAKDKAWAWLEDNTPQYEEMGQ